MFIIIFQVIQNVFPHVVVLELCASRTNILSLDEKTILEEAKNVDFRKVVANIKSNGLYNGIMYILLLNMSAHITKELGMAPGGEFRAAYREVLHETLAVICFNDSNIRLKNFKIVKYF